jgi:hypothetical protein
MPPIDKKPPEKKLPPVEPQPKKELPRKYEDPDPTVLGAKAADPKLGAAGASVYLNDMSEFGFRGAPSYWTFGKNGRVGATLTPNLKAVVKGKTSEKILGTHPDNGTYARVCYSLGKRAVTLDGAVALSEDEAPARPSSATHWLILGDGKVLWRSRAIAELGVVEEFKVDVSDISIVELRAYTEGFNHGCHAVWVDPKVKVKE